MMKYVFFEKSDLRGFSFKTFSKIIFFWLANTQIIKMKVWLFCKFESFDIDWNYFK